MLPEIFRDAKVGDEVFSPDYGWGKIRRIDNDIYSICVAFDTKVTSFTREGLALREAVAPTLFPSHLVPQYYLDLCPRPRRKVVKTVDVWLNIYKDGSIYHHNTEEQAKNNCGGNTTVVALKLTGTYEVEE